MTIQQLEKKIQSQITNGTLVLPSNALGSNGIQQIIEANFTDKKLIINGAQMTTSATSVTVTGKVSFQAVTDMQSTAVFQLVNSDVTLMLTASLPSTWTFSHSFPSLTGTFFDKLTLTGSKMIMASADQTTPEALTKGLNFQGQISGGLPTPVSSLLSSSVSLAGSIQIENGVPRMDLVLNPAIKLRLGSLSLPAVYCSFATVPFAPITSDSGDTNAQDVPWKCSQLVKFSSLDSPPVFRGASWERI